MNKTWREIKGYFFSEVAISRFSLGVRGLEFCHDVSLKGCGVRQSPHLPKL